MFHGFNFCSSKTWTNFFVMCMRKPRGRVELSVVSMMVDISINGVGVICRFLFVDVIILDFIILYFMIIYIYMCVWNFFLTWWSVKCFNYFHLQFKVIYVLQSYEIVQFSNLINYKFTKFTMFTKFTCLQNCQSNVTYNF